VGPRVDVLGSLSIDTVDRCCWERSFDKLEVVGALMIWGRIKLQVQVSLWLHFLKIVRELWRRIFWIFFRSFMILEALRSLLMLLLYSSAKETAAKSMRDFQPIYL
jgi:hypothetical protein